MVREEAAVLFGAILSGAYVFVWSTFIFDCAHFLLARYGWCKNHTDRLLIQIGIEVVAAATMLFVFPLLPVFLGAAGLVARFLYEAARPLQLPDGRPPSPRRGFITDASYHAMHRLFPEAYFGSVTTAFDRVFGTGTAVKGRRVVITGSSGSFGAPFARLLGRAGAEVTPLKFGVNYTYYDYSRCDAALADADILVLAHGAKGDLAMQANCDSFLYFIERFKTLNAKRGTPPEVWAVGSEIEAHPAWGNAELQVYLESKRAFARHARRYFWDAQIIYRHIVPSAFKSAMGPGLISGTFAARWAWFFIVRGFRYVPVSYTGIAFINWFKFLLRINVSPAPQLPSGGTSHAE
jgi:hypothetical protein